MNWIKKTIFSFKRDPELNAKNKIFISKINIYLGPYCTENGFSKWLLIEFGLRRMNTIESRNCMVLVI